MEDLELTILGSSSAIPISNRNPSSQFLSIANRHFLIDCGEGTQVRLRQNNIGFGRINHIFISHLHGDHFYGLVPLLTSLHLLDRRKAINLYGPPELGEAVEGILKVSGARLRFERIYHCTSSEQKKLIYEDEALKVFSFPLDHSMDCCGFLFQEKERPRNMNKEKLQEYRIPHAEIRKIKRGADWQSETGETIANNELTEAPAPPLSYAYCTDTLPRLDLDQYLPPVNLLYHEATFTDEHIERAEKTKHSTAKQAATVAHKVKANNLLLGHFSVRYRDLEVLLQEALSIFEPSHLALEDHVFSLKRGQSTLHIRK